MPNHNESSLESGLDRFWRATFALSEQYGRLRTRLVPEVAYAYRVDCNKAEDMIHGALLELLQKFPPAGPAAEADFQYGLALLRKTMGWRRKDEVDRPQNRREEPMPENENGESRLEITITSKDPGPEYTCGVIQRYAIASALLPKLFKHLHRDLPHSLSDLAQAIGDLGPRHGLGDSLQSRAMALRAMLFHDCDAMSLPPRKVLAAEAACKLGLSAEVFDTRCSRLRNLWREALDETFDESLPLPA